MPAITFDPDLAVFDMADRVVGFLVIDLRRGRRWRGDIDWRRLRASDSRADDGAGGSAANYAGGNAAAIAVRLS